MKFWRGFRCRYQVRFWRVEVQILAEVPSGADTWCGAGGFRYVQIAGEVAEGSGAGTRYGSRKFRCR